MKNVLITGGASGLGKTLCKAFKENGYNVIFTYHNTIPTDMDGMYKIKCDLASEEDINNAQEEIITKFGYIDVLVNNAAVEINKDFDIKTKEDALKMFEQTGVDAIMIGRASIGNPWIFKEIQEYLTGQEITPVSNEEKLEIILEHIDLQVKYLGENTVGGVCGAVDRTCDKFEKKHNAPKNKSNRNKTRTTRLHNYIF